MIELSWVAPSQNDLLHIEGLVPFRFDSWHIFGIGLDSDQRFDIDQLSSMVMLTGTHYYAVVFKKGHWYEVNDHFVIPIDNITEYLYDKALQYPDHKRQIHRDVD